MPPFVGNTGEEYARHLEEVVVLDTADPSEAARYVTYLSEHPVVQARLLARVHVLTAASQAQDRPRPGATLRTGPDPRGRYH